MAFTVLAIILSALAAQALSAPSSHHSSKILSGIAAKDGDFPYIAAVTSPFSATCGSAILSEKWVLTLASCCSSLTNTGSFVYYGSVLLSGDGTNVTIAQSIIHPDYSPSEFKNDLCLLELTEEIKFSNNTKAITLPKAGELPTPGTVVVTAGWGDTFSTTNYEGSDQLYILPRSVVIDHELCAAVGPNDIIENGCAFASDNADACAGDFGDPVVANGVLYGLINVLQRFCGIGSPFIYVNIPLYIDWITETINSGNNTLI